MCTKPIIIKKLHRYVMSELHGVDIGRFSSQPCFSLVWDWPCFWQECMRLIFSFWERVTASNLCGGGQSTFGGKDRTYKKLNGRWCGFAALIRGGRPIRRLQLFVKALCHHYPDNPLACPCVDGHLSGGTLHSWNTSKLSFNFIRFSHFL